MTEIIKTIHSASAAETTAAGFEFATLLKAGDGVLYKGEMGAGKTYFTKGIAQFFDSSEPAVSPTFALVNEYPARLPIFHFDLFRLNTEDDLYAIGFFDYLDRNGICCIEWSENIPESEQYFANYYIVSITKTGENSRLIEIERGQQ